MGPIPPTPDASRSSASDSSMAEDYDATDDSLTHEGRAVYGVIYNLGNHWAMSWGNFLLLKLSPLQCGVFHFGVRVGCREFHWGELPGRKFILSFGLRYFPPFRSSFFLLFSPPFQPRVYIAYISFSAYLSPPSISITVIF